MTRRKHVPSAPYRFHVLQDRRLCRGPQLAPESRKDGRYLSAPFNKHNFSSYPGDWALVSLSYCLSISLGRHLQLYSLHKDISPGGGSWHSSESSILNHLCQIVQKVKGTLQLHLIKSWNVPASLRMESLFHLHAPLTALKWKKINLSSTIYLCSSNCYLQILFSQSC